MSSSRSPETHASAWSTQQLAEFIAAVSPAKTEAAAARAAVERAAEALDADVAAIICGGNVVAAVGYPEGTTPVAELERVAMRVDGSRLEVPGAGACSATAAALEHPPGATLVIARSGPDGLTREESGLLRGMARVASLTMRMLRVLDDERAAREELERLAREQAALRRVATLVAEAAAPDDVFSAVAEEVGHVLAAADVAMVCRYDRDAVMEIVGAWSRTSDAELVGRQMRLGGRNVSTLVFETSRPARVDRFPYDNSDVAAIAHEIGMRSSVGAPISIEGRLWGVVIVTAALEDTLPADTEHRLAEFTELVATAIANAEAREELRRVADEQAALRRVATLVARGTAPAAVFAAVAEEVGRLLLADLTIIGQYNPDDTATVVAAWSGSGDSPPAGRRHSTTGSAAALVRETWHPARIDNYAADTGAVPAAVLEFGIRSAVAAPITVEGGLWGFVTVASRGDEPPPAGTEARLANFTELVATAIANAETQAELTASRARIVATADETRRRIERDLHDGAQQRLVALALQLRAAQAALPPELGELEAELERVEAGLTSALDELREYARGIHPAILAERGLGSALRTLANRSSLPVELDVRTEARLPERVEVAAYYVVSEALANAAKHANASSVAVDVEAADGVLRLSVSDDGVGGADPRRGSGLVGLKDRIEATGGRLTLQSRPAEGTRLLVELPLELGPPRDGGA